MASNSGDCQSRPVEAYPRLLREGEVSPFKVLVAILLRENFKHPEVKLHTPLSRIALARFFYKLVNCDDISYNELRQHIKDSVNCVPNEIKMSFCRITEHLDDENPGFLYELVPSMIDQFDASQIVLLGKRIYKNSPIGKFLRLLLLSIRKMSYPQVFHLYKQVCVYIKKDLDPARNILPKPGAPCVPKSFSKLYLQQHPPLFKGEPKLELDAFTKMVQDRLVEGKEGIDLSVHSTYHNVLKGSRNELTPEQIDDIKSAKADKLTKYQNAIERSAKSLRAAWKSATNIEGTDLIPSVQVAPSTPKKQIPKSRKRSRTPRKDRKMDTIASVDDLIIVRENEEGYLPSDDDIAEPMEVTDNTLISQRTRSQCSSSLRKRGPEQNVQVVMDKLNLNSPAAVPISDDESFVLQPPSKRWDDIKWHSRKSIDRTIKILMGDMQYIGNKRYTPKEISYFVESIRHNPSAQGLLPQLFFLEYMNCLQLKDLTRCTESLRTSFDLRVKPMTAEIGKGTPYAAYIFAIFYKYLGFKKDSMSYLEEAFQAAHSAWDRVCLEYCHNLWARFHNKAYVEAISSSPNNVDKNMAYLHCYNTIASTFDNQNRGSSPVDTFQMVWKSNADHEFETVESLLLMSLANLYSIFGWNFQAELMCTIILASSSSIRWPVRYYCTAICMYSTLLLLKGEIEQADLISNYGKQLFSGESTISGEIFSSQDAIFYAMKSFLAYNPIEDSVLSTIFAFNKTEAYYWSAYNKMILNDWDEAGQMIACLFSNLDSKNYENSDLKIRGYLLNAEIRCLQGNTMSALQYLFDGLKLAEFLNAEFFISLFHINIALIQNYLGLPSTAGRTLNQNPRTVLRCCTPYLRARLYLANIRISMNYSSSSLETSKKSNMNLFEIYNLFISTYGGEKQIKRQKFSSNSHKTSKSKIDLLLERISKVEDIYKTWKNQYRLKETCYIKSLVYKYAGDTDKMNKTEQGLNEMKSFCPWSIKTCII